MAKPSIWAKKFDRTDEFVARKNMVASGKIILPGQIIDKKLFTTRRLRQLYDWRFIEVANVRPFVHDIKDVPFALPAEDQGGQVVAEVKKPRGRRKRAAA